MKRHSMLWLCALAPALAGAADGDCRVRHGGPPPRVVELFTSEGCSSCPRAEAWLNGLKGRTDVLPLAFHVGYWDHLGWTDRFASAEATQRQRQLAALDGRGVYTPQVRADGVDWRRWPALPAAPAADPGPRPTLTLARDGEGVSAQVDPLPGRTLAGYWVVLEDGHRSRVGAGENRGSTLHHDHVVRLYRPLPPWQGAQGLRSHLAVSRGVAEHPRRVAFVVVDAGSQRPLQALVLGC